MLKKLFGGNSLKGGFLTNSVGYYRFTLTDSSMFLLASISFCGVFGCIDLGYK